MLSEIYVLVMGGEITDCEFVDPYDGELLSLYDFQTNVLRDVSFRYSAFPSGEVGECAHLSAASESFIESVYDAFKAPKRDKNLF